MKFLKEGFGRMFEFHGRTRRSNFWQFMAFSGLVYGSILLLPFDSSFLQIIFVLIFGLPLITIQVRRLKDSSKSPFLILLHLIPFGIGSIILLIMYCIDGDYDENKYGVDPKFPPVETKKKYCYACGKISMEPKKCPHCGTNYSEVK